MATTQRTDASTRRRLGRGLESLMTTRVPIEEPGPVVGAGSTAPAGPAPADRDLDEPAGRVIRIPLDRIRPGRDQPRQEFAEEALEALAASIRAAGVMQPIVVRPAGDGGPPRYEIVVGERRWRAAARIGLTSIPAVVREVDDRTAAEWALIENIQREDLNPIERAEAFRRLTDRHGLTHQELADRVGLNRSSVTNFLRLNELDDWIKEAIRRGRLTPGHAKVLLSVASPEARRTLAELAIRQSWAVRQLEQRVGHLAGPRPAKGGSGGAPPGRAGGAQVQGLARRIGEQLGTKVSIVEGRTKGSGRLVIEFYSLDQFDGLVARLGIRLE